jgi:hypothetical protein
MSSNLPAELQQFAALLDAQPGPIQAAFQDATARDNTWRERGCTVFEPVAGDRFSVVRPRISQVIFLYPLK